MYDFSSFDSFIATTNGQTIGQGECWDYINLIWDHLGSRYYTYPPSDPSSTNHGVKWGVLNAEALAANQISGLTYISDKTQLKRGDIVVSTDGTFGHAGFINQDYNVLTLNYGFYTQNYAGRRSVALDTYTLNDFGGAFRYDAWVQPTPPTPPFRRGKFPWVLYARKLREKNQL